MPDSFDLASLKRFSSEVSTFTDGGLRYIHLPALRLPDGCAPSSCDALLCMDARDGYPTRLFFASRIETKVRELNWNLAPVVAGAVWQAYSWTGVQSTQPVAVLMGHVQAFMP